MVGSLFIIYIYIYIYIIKIDGAASINTGLELVGVVEPVRRAGSIYNLHKKGGPARECRPPLRWLSQFFSHKRERNQLLMVL